jgi:ankyrin repeat protein
MTVARHLIDHGADFKRLDPTGHSPLHLAAHYAKDSQILELLLTQVEIDQCDSTGITALHSATIASNAVSARYLIEKGADINRVDKRGRTPVHAAAAFAKNVDFFNIFLGEEKADLGCCDERKLTVLAYAKINQFGLAKEIVSSIEKKNNDKPKTKMIGDSPTDSTNRLMIAKAEFMKALPRKFFWRINFFTEIALLYYIVQ